MSLMTTRVDEAGFNHFLADVFFRLGNVTNNLLLLDCLSLTYLTFLPL